MPTLTNLPTLASVALDTVPTSGPNMIYLIPRPTCQGRNAGLVPLADIATGFVFYMLRATFNITTLSMIVSSTYGVLRFGDAVYLLYLVWRAVRPGGRALFQVRELPVDSPRKLYMMGLLTSLLNPKMAVLYLSPLPQLIESVHDSVLVQPVCLGLTQVYVSLTVNPVIAATASNIAALLSCKSGWLPVQRYLMGTVPTNLALHTAMEARKQPHEVGETVRRRIKAGRSGLAGSSRSR